MGQTEKKSQEVSFTSLARKVKRPALTPEQRAAMEAQIAREFGGRLASL